jgi:integrase
MNALITIDPLEEIVKLNKEATDHYRPLVDCWIRWMRENAATPSEESLRAYFRHLLNDSGHSARTIMLKRQAVKKRIRQLFEDRPLDDQARLETLIRRLDRGTDTKAPKVNGDQVGQNKILTPAEYSQILMACRTNKQRLFIRFLWDTGVRVNEMTRATLANCKTQGGIVTIRLMGKGSKEREVFIYDDLFHEIREEFNGQTYLFETSTGRHYNNDYVSHQIKKIGQRIDRNISAHTLRHSFITRQIQEHPEKIKSISEYAGHSSVEITLRRYCHITMSAQEILGKRSDKECYQPMVEDEAV